MLPRLSGLRVVRGCARAGNWMPVLMVSAKDGEYDQADGLDLGADDYLAKPFSFVVLLARLRALVAGARGSPGPAVLRRAGDLRLRPRAARQVTPPAAASRSADRARVRAARVPAAPRAGW